ncbi:MULTISPECIES: tripartite tricarboxylate transporter substrate binding protein [unclassified Polynucleobacter]|uniref:Bug family tripartite tricarboxylate transporter substrate binding protein n=1 Tax=unclassified Polynucleobacter TaxID=2640945 RepID=UPI0008B28E1A|nr:MULTISPECIES: tripartite tricarboxylate transporter substrate binding protein [unclassified Polynucleobacter]OHC09306.1 MAG: hypothetical protein A2X74_08020 [Polynucleobacter sp. GWA2_45_21]HBK44000.1 tripartite tricarboxylate transporter substrate binding protein [Polynucleobacter sp.]
MKIIKNIWHLLVLASIFGASFAAFAQSTANYPDKTIKIIVPYAPGAFNDAMARIFARKLQASMGQPVVVENKPGGGTVIGTDAAAKSAPDGYTLVVNGFPLTVNQFLLAKLPYDTKKDLTPVILGGETPNVLLVREDSPFKTLQEFVAYAKANPGKLNYAASGAGTSQALSMEYLKSIAGIYVTQINYKGSAPMVTDLLGGHVDVMFDNFPNAMPHVKAGKMRALGITSAKRVASAPNIPTIAEQGYPGFDVSVWYGIFAPANVPAPILQKLNAELNKALKSDDVKDNFAAAGVFILGGSIDDFAKFNKAQDAKWSSVISKSGIKAE